MNRTPRSFAGLCRVVYLLTQMLDPTTGPARGWRWERRIADGLAAEGYPARSIPSGVEIQGVLPASGLRHQIDADIGCSDALVIGEWKAYHRPVPKNEILRFKAVTDDVYEAMSSFPLKRPVMRVFGIAGDAAPDVRRYTARHGIALIERSRWPAPALADPALPWPAALAPTAVDLDRLRWLSRRMQQTQPKLPDGSFRLPPRPRPPAIEAALDVQDRWSARLWEMIDADPDWVARSGWATAA